MGVALWLAGAGLLATYGLAAGPGFAAVGSGWTEPAHVESGRALELDFAVYRATVEPIFTRPRGGYVAGAATCVTCHTWQASTPLKLQPLQIDASGAFFWTEEQSRLNFQAVARLVAPGDPDNSRLLRKPLARDAGGAESHVGGTFWSSKDDPEWQVIADWVRSASADAVAAPPPPPNVDFDFFRSCVQPIFLNPIPGAVACQECHGGGGNAAFARSIAGGRDFWDEAESRQNFEVILRLIEPGYPMNSRFLMHPLHPAAGGDSMHNGGRRWMSTVDPEWQMLAAWVRGERTGSTCPTL